MSPVNPYARHAPEIQRSRISPMAIYLDYQRLIGSFVLLSMTET